MSSQPKPRQPKRPTQAKRAASPRKVAQAEEGQEPRHPQSRHTAGLLSREVLAHGHGQFRGGVKARFPGRLRSGGFVMVDTTQPRAADTAQPPGGSQAGQESRFLKRTWAAVTLQRDCWWEQRVSNAWLRHGIYWFIAGALIVWNALNAGPLVSLADRPQHPNWDAVAVWLFAVIVVFFAVVGLFLTIRQLEHAKVKRTVSRSLVLITLALGVAAITLYQTQRMGLHIENCAIVGKKENCGGVASERHVFGMLAWHAANVVPVLDIPKSTGWSRPARSSAWVVIGIILLVRLWVAIGLLAVIKRLWDKWSVGSSSGSSTTV